MRLFYSDESRIPTYEEVRDACRKGYGVKHPEKISGFEGFFFHLDDIYLYGRLETAVNANPEMEAELFSFIERYKRQDYGFISRLEYDGNLENRYLCGSCAWTVGRYSFSERRLQQAGGVVLEFLRDVGFLYFVDEDMTDIYQQYIGQSYSGNDMIYRKPQ